LLALEGIVPETALPALAIDDRELDGRTETFRRGIRREGFDELCQSVVPLVSTTTTPVVSVLEIPQGLEQVSSRDPQQTQSPLRAFTSAARSLNCSASMRAF
jgi:hypothetical protein